MPHDWMVKLTTGRRNHLIADMHMHAREADGGNDYYRY